MLSIALASFFNDITMPGSWTACMDIGGKFTGTVSGAMNMMGNLGGFVSPIVLGYIVDGHRQLGNLTGSTRVRAGLYFVGADLLAVHRFDQAAAAGLRRVAAVHHGRGAGPAARPFRC